MTYTQCCQGCGRRPCLCGHDYEYATVYELASLIELLCRQWCSRRGLDDQARTQPPGVLAYLQRRSPTHGDDHRSWPLSLVAYEREVVLRALVESGHNALAAAQALGISKSAMYRKMERLGLSRGRGVRRGAMSLTRKRGGR